MTKEVYYRCPKCGSALLDLPATYGGIAKCEACGWEGEDYRLIANPILSGSENIDDHIHEMNEDLKNLVRVVTDLNQLNLLLYKYGLISHTQPDEDGNVSFDEEESAIYKIHIGGSLIKAVFEARKLVEKHRVKRDKEGN